MDLCSIYSFQEVSVSWKQIPFAGNERHIRLQRSEAEIRCRGVCVLL